MVRPLPTWDDGRTMSSTPTPPAYRVDPGHQTRADLGAAPRHVYRRATRDTQERVIGGVAAGLAAHLGVPVLWVRVAFVITAALGGAGVAMYAGLWMVLPTDERFAEGAPGLESATRRGARPRRVRRLVDAGPAIALGALGFGVLLIVEAFLGQGAVFWPLLIATVGIALLWRQADEAQRERWLDSTGRIDPVRMVFGSGTWQAVVRVAAGAVLIVVAIAVFALREGGINDLYGVLLSAAVGFLGLAIVVGPWVVRLAGDLTAERAERVRTQERADMAAHLHDSVLQTLALIQKNSGDAAMVARLARSQERDLRSWLFEGESKDSDTLSGALRAMAAEVEDTHGVDVDLVFVGDCPFGDHLRAVVQRHPGGDGQRRQARRHRQGRRVRRGVAGRGRGLRPRPRGRLRPRRRAGGPDGRARQHRGQDGPPRRLGRHPVDPGRGHGGAPAPAAQGCRRGERCLRTLLTT